MGPRLFQEYRFYSTYEEWEDLPYFVNYVGDNHLVVGAPTGDIMAVGRAEVTRQGRRRSSPT